MPALLKAFLEQVFRPGFALPQVGAGQRWQKLLTGMIEAPDKAKRGRWLAKMRTLGGAGR